MEPSKEPELDQLSKEALTDQDATLLPAREALSLIMPGSTADVAAADFVPVEAQQWHGNPDDPHIM